MANTLGWKHITFRLVPRKLSGAILPGHQITGFADEDPPVEMPIIEVETETWGKDGTLFTATTGRQGGEVKIKLLPVSVSTKYLMRKHAEILKGERYSWSGIYGDLIVGYHSLLKGGRLKMAPVTVSPEVTAEFTFVFEQIIPAFDTVKFEPSPALTS